MPAMPQTAQEVDHRDLHVRLPFAASRTLAAFPSEYHALAHRTWSRLDEARPLHITMKMAGATPACLPHNMRSALGSILEVRAQDNRPPSLYPPLYVEGDPTAGSPIVPTLDEGKEGAFSCY